MIEVNINAVIGPMVRLNIAGSEMLILNEIEDIDELVSLFGIRSRLVQVGDRVLFSW